MPTLLFLKTVHMSLAALSVSGFAVRGLWMVQGSAHLDRRWVRVLPHVIDSLLLLSGLTLAFGWQVSPLTHPWFAAKLMAIIVYIVAGTVALKPGRPRRIRIVALLVALVAVGYVVSAATTRLPLLFG